MADPNTPKDPADAAKKASDEAIMHELVFKKKQEANDVPAPTSDAAAVFGLSPVQLEKNAPMRHIGDSDLPDFQPDGSDKRR